MADGQVLLGLGMATLIPTKGTPCVTVAGSVKGARVAGLLLQAGTSPDGGAVSPTLLQWGDDSRDSASRVAPADYGFIHDVFARVGGPKLPKGEQAKATSMMQIDSNGVIGDNMWLWRADHSEGGGLVKNGDNPCDNALIVNGDDVSTQDHPHHSCHYLIYPGMSLRDCLRLQVTMYGLAAEHTLKDIVLWNGDRGSSYFFQAELPYDVKTYPYAGYHVADDVDTHKSYGAGVYHFFRERCPVSY